MWNAQERKMHARFWWENFNNFKMDFKETELKFFDQIQLPQDRGQWHTLVNTRTSRL
jgi:hypothetical protein